MEQEQQQQQQQQYQQEFFGYPNANQSRRAPQRYVRRLNGAAAAAAAHAKLSCRARIEELPDDYGCAADLEPDEPPHQVAASPVAQRRRDAPTAPDPRADKLARAETLRRTIRNMSSGGGGGGAATLPSPSPSPARSPASASLQPRRRKTGVAGRPSPRMSPSSSASSDGGVGSQTDAKTRRPSASASANPVWDMLTELSDDQAGEREDYGYGTQEEEAPATDEDGEPMLEAPGEDLASVLTIVKPAIDRFRRAKEAPANPRLQTRLYTEAPERPDSMQEPPKAAARPTERPSSPAAVVAASVPPATAAAPAAVAQVVRSSTPSQRSSAAPAAETAMEGPVRGSRASRTTTSTGRAARRGPTLHLDRDSVAPT